MPEAQEKLRGMLPHVRRGVSCTGEADLLTSEGRSALQHRPPVYGERRSEFGVFEERVLRLIEEV